MTPVSTRSQDQGLPQLRAGCTINGAALPPTASGNTATADVFAFRVGTVINIVNGGLGANRLPLATNMWDAKVSVQSPNPPSRAGLSRITAGAHAAS